MTQRASGAPPRNGDLGATGVTVVYSARSTPALDDVSVELNRGMVTAIVGPNGSGKSTLLRTLGRLAAPDSGSVLLDGRDIFRYPTRELARELGILAQAPVSPDGLTVLDLVSRGRDPHRRWYDQWSKSDEDLVLAAIARTGIEALSYARIDELSGGQRQRAWIAMALAQETKILLLDEPTTFLDIAHQLDVLELLRSMHDNDGVTIVMVLHDLTMAARYADRIIAVKDGRIHSDGTPEVVLTPEFLADVFAVDATVIPDPNTGRPHIIPFRRTGGQ